MAATAQNAPAKTLVRPTTHERSGVAFFTMAAALSLGRSSAAVLHGQAIGDDSGMATQAVEAGGPSGPVAGYERPRGYGGLEGRAIEARSKPFEGRSKGR